MIIIPAGPVNDFVEATNRHDADALLAVFAAQATVLDDGSTSTGHDEIRQWIHEHQITPEITLDPTEYDETDPGTVQLSASADGDFPGAPLPFVFHFTLDAGQVTALDVRFAG